MQNKPALKIIAIAGFIAISVFIVVIAAILSYNFATGQTQAQRGTITSGQGSSGSSSSDSDAYLPPEDINILLLGVDEHNLADMMLIIHYSGYRGTIDVMSLPRDTRFQFSDAQRAELVERGVNNPPTFNFLINSIVGRSGGVARGGREFAKQAIGDMLDIEIHHYVTIYLEGFKSIVDAVGGISMYVPQRLLYQGIWLEHEGRFDPGEIHIDIPHGYQLLNGHQAEQAIRFRHHPRGDFFRIEMQQRFMQAFFEQALTLEALTNNPLALITSLITHINTDIGIHNIDQMLRQGILEGLNPDSINFHLIPNHRAGGQYHLTTPDAQNLVQSVLDGSIHIIPEPEDEENNTTE